MTIFYTEQWKEGIFTHRHDLSDSSGPAPLEKLSSSWQTALRQSLPLILAAAILLFTGLCLRDISFMDILEIAPSSYFWAALVLWGLYAFKSLTVFFPLTALYISSGVLFPLWLGLAVNLAGLFISLTLPYLVGRRSGSRQVDKLVKRYPLLQKFVSRPIGDSSRNSGLTEGNCLFTAYLLRTVGIIPGDITSLFLGASGFPYAAYLSGSLLGMFPMMLLFTMTGSTVGEPLTLPFVLLFLLVLLLTLGFTLISRRMMKKRNREVQKEEDLYAVE